MFKNTANIISLALIAGLLLYACDDSSSSDNDEFDDGVRVEIIDILGEENLDILENELNMPIHRGQNPPDLQGFYNSVVLNLKNPNTAVEFVISPLEMIESLVEGDEDRDLNFLDLYVRLSEQDLDDFTISYETIHLNESEGISISSYIIGEDDAFTIAGEVVTEREEGTVRTAQVLSGLIHEEGIAETHYSLIMIDNDDIDGVIPNGTGRTFIDDEGLSVLTEFPGNGDEQVVKSGDKISSFWDLIQK